MAKDKKKTFIFGFLIYIGVCFFFAFVFSTIYSVDSACCGFEVANGSFWINDSGTLRYSDGDVNVSNSLYVGNLYFGNTSGAYNETRPNRPLTTNASVNLTVCAVGCNYTTIQDAMYDLPYILRHRYEIHIMDGVYNEDVIIPPTVVSAITNSDGAQGGLRLWGEGMDKVKVKSIMVNGATGINNPSIYGMEIYGQEPRSDENTSLSFYSVTSGLAMNINFTAPVKHAVLNYGGGVGVHSSVFNNQEVGLWVKIGTWGYFGNNYHNSYNSGTLTESLVTVSQGIATVNSLNNVIAPNIFSCDHWGSYDTHGIGIYRDNIYCLGEHLEKGVSDNDLLMYINLNNNTQDFSSYHRLVYNTGGAILYDDGIFNEGRIFNANGTYITATNSENWIGNKTQLTINFWAKPNLTQPNSTSYMMRGKYDNVGFSINNNSYWGFIVLEEDGSYDSIGDIKPAPVNEWSMITGVYNADENYIKVYVDGALVGKSNTPNDKIRALNTSEHFYMGWEGLNNRFYNGSLDQIMIWGRALSDGEVKALYSLSEEYVDGGRLWEYDTDTSNISTSFDTVISGNDFYVDGGNINIYSGNVNLELGNLNIHKNVGATPDLFIQAYGDRTENSPTIRINNTHNSIDANNVTGLIVFESSDSSAGGRGDSGALKIISENAGTNYALTLSTRAGALGLNEWFRISAYGKVGIKTTAPNQTLHVNGYIQTNLTGAGNGFACLTADGVLYRSAVVCA